MATLKQRSDFELIEEENYLQIPKSAAVWIKKKSLNVGVCIAFVLLILTYLETDLKGQLPVYLKSVLWFCWNCRKHNHTDARTQNSLTEVNSAFAHAHQHARTHTTNTYTHIQELIKLTCWQGAMGRFAVWERYEGTCTCKLHKSKVDIWTRADKVNIQGCLFWHCTNLQCVCVFLYILDSEYYNLHFTSVVRTFGLLLLADGKDLVLGSGWF